MDDNFFKIKDIFIERLPDNGIAESLWVKDILDDWEQLTESQRKDQYRASKVLYYTNAPIPESKDERIADKWDKTQELKKTKQDREKDWVNMEALTEDNRLKKEIVFNIVKAVVGLAVFFYFTWDTLKHFKVL